MAWQSMRKDSTSRLGSVTLYVFMAPCSPCVAPQRPRTRLETYTRAPRGEGKSRSLQTLGAPRSADDSVYLPGQRLDLQVESTPKSPEKSPFSQRGPSCRAFRRVLTKTRVEPMYGNRDSGPREMFDTVCSDCGKATQVPFKPTEGRPVYCRDCFQKHRPPRRDDRRFSAGTTSAPRA